MTTPWQSNDLARRTTVTELVNAWRESERQIREGFAAISAAQTRMGTFFEDRRRSFDIANYRTCSIDFNEPETAIAHFKKSVWGAIVNRLELRKILSLKRIQELDKQIETGEGLPDITVENVNAMLETNLNMMGQYLEEKVKEVYEWLRPRGWRLEYKTNLKSVEAGVGLKLIIGYGVERCWRHDGGYSIHYNRRDELRALDQVFHMLDGKEQPRSHYGEIVDAVEQQTRSGTNTWETTYFKGKCFQNQNLHLEFKRPDLVEKFNLVAAGARLTDEKRFTGAHHENAIERRHP